MKKNGKSSFSYVKDGDYGNASCTNEYIAYVISHLSNQLKKGDDCLDVAWERSIELADRFIGSKFDVGTKGLFECVEDFLNPLTIGNHLI